MRNIALLLPVFGAFVALVDCGSPSDGAAPRPDVETAARPIEPAKGDDAGSPVDAPSEVTDGGAAVDAAVRAPPPPPSLSAPFTLGYNEAWFGPSYASDLTTNFDLARVNATFDGIVAGGGRVVRVWLFELLEGIAVGPTPPRIGDVSPTLLANLELVLQAARARGLGVYLTALDGNAMPEEAGPTRDLYWNMLNGAYGEADAYETKVLAPTLARIAPYADVLYAFDLVNEIEAPRHRGFWADPIGGPRAYLQRSIAFVKARAPWLKVTASAGHDTAAYDLAFGLFSGVGFDFYDLHVYSDQGTIPNLGNVCSKAAADGIPVILGEFGQLAHVDDDTLQANVTTTFVNAAKGSCFKGALAWRYDAAESYWRFIRPDGSPRPAVAVMKSLSP